MCVAVGISGAGLANSPANAVWASEQGGRAPPPLYAAAANRVNMNAEAVANAEETQPHNNLPPFLIVNFIIALQGIFPPRG
ncbi:MAG: hypothetical protein WCA20_25550 [Candidatus Sulfotelmatobacter sp.]